MNKYKKLAFNTIIFSVGSFSAKIFSLLLNNLYTQHLSPSGLYTKTLIETLVLFLLPVFTFSLTEAVVRYGLDNEYDNKQVFTTAAVITLIHNIEMRPGQGAKLVRSAGNFAQLTSREGSYCVIKLPSGETRQILSACKATVGSVGNSDHALEQSGKAGRSRWLGQRPHNRGVVMNPHDHPMGGGEGRQSGGHPRSRKGLYAKGLKTRAPKKLSNKYIIERANKK